MPWQDSAVIVTGATRGIGRAVVEMLVGRGARVGCIARSADELQQLETRVRGPGSVACAPADIADETATTEAVTALADRHGPPDVLVNNAGIGLHGAVIELDPADAERVMQVNYMGVVHATCAALPSMLRRRNGHIVTIGSIAGRLGGPFEAAYSASKFAAIGFSEAMGVELAPFGIAVSILSPGPVATSFFEARGHPYDRRRPKQLDPATVAAAVVRAVETGGADRVIPRSLASAVVIRHLVPRLYRWGAGASFRTELAQLVRDLD